MANLTIENIDNAGVLLESDPLGFEPGLLVFSGADTYVDGTILARKAVADAIVVAADAGNTGDGTVTLAAVTAGPTVPLVGAYNLECTVATANGGTFKLEDPNGAVIDANMVLLAGAGAATIFSVGGMTFTVTDGAVDFIVGDKFSLTVAVDGRFYAYAADGLGGVQVPSKILLGETSATGAGTVAIRALKFGKVRKDQLVIDAVGVAGSGITAAIVDSLQHYGIVSQPARELNTLDNQ